MKRLILLALSSISLIQTMEQEKFVYIILNKVTNKTNQYIGLNIQSKEFASTATGTEIINTAATPIIIIKPGPAKPIKYTLTKPMPSEYDIVNLDHLIFLTKDKKYGLSVTPFLTKGNLSTRIIQDIFNENGKLVNGQILSDEDLPFNPNENVNIYIDVILKGENLSQPEVDLYATEGTPQGL